MHLRQVGDPGPAAGILHRPADLRKDVRLSLARPDLVRIGDGGGAMAPAADPGQILQPLAPGRGPFRRPPGGREEDHRRPVGHLTAVQLSGPSLHHRVQGIVLGETVLREAPLPGLGIGIATAIGEVDLRDPQHMGGVEAVAALVFLRQVGEGSRPRELRIQIFVPRPGRRPQVLRRLLAGDIAHLLDADDAGEVVASRLDLRRRRQDGHAAGRAGRLVPGGGHAVEVRVNEAEEAPEQPLSGKQVSDEVTHMAALDVLWLQSRGVQAMAHHVGEDVRQFEALPGPVRGEVRLPAAQDIGHVASVPVRAAGRASAPGRWMFGTALSDRAPAGPRPRRSRYIRRAG